MASRTSFSVGAVAIIALLMALAVVGGLSFIAGGIVGQEQLYATWRQRKLDKLAVVLEATEFSGVRAEHSSADQVYLTGTLPDPETHRALSERLIDAFGSQEAERMLSLVEVATSLERK